MEEQRYDGSVKFTDLFADFTKKEFDPQVAIMQAVNNPENKTVIIHKKGSRTIYGGVVYEFQSGKRKSIGYSWQNTTETIQEHENKKEF